MKNMEDAKKGFTEVFLDKLKEQSFTIVLMVGILVYQTINKNAEIEKLEKQIGVKQEYIDKMVEDQRQRWQVREQYLMQQRDTYIEDLLKQNTKQNMTNEQIPTGWQGGFPSKDNIFPNLKNFMRKKNK